MNSVLSSVRSLMQMFDGKVQEFISDIDNVHVVWLEEIQQEANRMFSRDFNAEPELMPKTPSQKKNSRRKRVSVGRQEENQTRRRFVAFTAVVVETKFSNFSKPEFSKGKRSNLRGSSVKSLNFIAEESIPEASTSEASTATQPKRTTRKNKQTKPEVLEEGSHSPRGSCESEEVQNRKPELVEEEEVDKNNTVNNAEVEPDNACSTTGSPPSPKVDVGLSSAGRFSAEKVNTAEVKSDKRSTSQSPPKIPSPEVIVSISSADRRSAELVVKPEPSPGRTAAKIAIRPNMRTFLHTVQKNQMLMMTPNSLGRTGVIKSFIKHTTPVRADPKRDERLRRVFEAKVKEDQREEEKKRKIAQKMAQIDEKNDKRLAEEKAKKKVALKRQEELEQKRLEEEARKKKIQQAEEEKRQQELLAKKKAEEEEQRARKMAEARKALELKREQERERERQAAAERERVEKEKALALQRELERAAREKERRELEEKRKALEEKRKQQSPQSYSITPKGGNKPLVLSKNPEDYGMDQNSDDSTDDESAPRKPIPSWAEGPNLQQIIMKQYFNPPDFDSFFGAIEPPKLENIFYKSKPRYFKRTSSAVWHSPPVGTKRKSICH
uniref:Inner centromere protein ARK-binding domain-containing protein n=1 Tax=Lates calcarifer TaxID=8187 RepID=A0A4W6DZ01_LATCA